MPTVIHAIFGGFTGLLFLLATKDASRRFNERAVIVFAFNAFIGPDIIKIPRIFIDPVNPALLALDQFLHSIVGWVFWSFMIAIPFWMLASAKARWPDALTYGNTVKLVVGAGLTHLGLDVLDLAQEGYGSLAVFPWEPAVRFNLDTFRTGHAWNGILGGLSTRAGAGVLFSTGVVFLCLLSYFLLKKQTSRAIISAFIFVATVMGLIIIFGSVIVYWEHDLGYFIYLSMFFFVPFALMYWAMQDTSVPHPDGKQFLLLAPRPRDSTREEGQP